MISYQVIPDTCVAINYILGKNDNTNKKFSKETEKLINKLNRKRGSCVSTRDMIEPIRRKLGFGGYNFKKKKG